MLKRFRRLLVIDLRLQQSDIGLAIVIALIGLQPHPLIGQRLVHLSILLPLLHIGTVIGRPIKKQQQPNTDLFLALVIFIAAAIGRLGHKHALAYLCHIASPLLISIALGRFSTINAPRRPASDELYTK